MATTIKDKSGKEIPLADYVKSLKKPLPKNHHWLRQIESDKAAAKKAAKKAAKSPKKED